MNSYEARRAAKAERYRQYAENAAKRAEQASNRLHQIMDGIPMGQPVLAGHHSERGHRADLLRMDASMQRASEEQGKAEYWRGKVFNLEHDTSISRDDPEAPAKLRAKIADLEAQIVRRKRVNQQLRRMKPTSLEHALELIAAVDLTDNERADLRALAKWGEGWRDLTGYGGGTDGLNANLRRYRQRLASLEQQP